MHDNTVERRDVTTIRNIRRNMCIIALVQIMMTVMTTMVAVVMTVVMTVVMILVAGCGHKSVKIVDAIISQLPARSAHTEARAYQKRGIRKTVAGTKSNI